jgi:hypothetical protein
VGRQARANLGPAALLLIGFAALPIRGMLFAFISNPSVLLAVQIFDGVTAAVFAVMVPLVVADLTRGTGHFNLGQGILGTATGIGASSRPADALRIENVQLRRELKNKDQTIDHLQLADRAKTTGQ